MVDSSGWLEYLADAENADFLAPAIEKPDQLVMPSISILEVFKWVLQERGEHAAKGPAPDKGLQGSAA